MEHLEPRTLLAGNVTAEVIDGNLFLRGDEFANDLFVIVPLASATPGNWLVFNRGGTVNGEDTGMSLPPVPGQVRAFLGRGKDALFLRDLDIAARLSVNLGRG